LAMRSMALLYRVTRRAEELVVDAWICTGA